MEGSVYKVMSKIMVAILCLMMGKLVEDTQSTVIHNRQIHDGALIACEAVAWNEFWPDLEIMDQGDDRDCVHVIDAEDGVETRKGDDYQVGNSPIKYFRIPLGANPGRIATCKSIIEKIEKLSSWKSNLLSKGDVLWKKIIEFCYDVDKTTPVESQNSINDGLAWSHILDGRYFTKSFVSAVTGRILDLSEKKRL
ncbi:hypothetical protein PIB30_028572 [Stylosanthes scabra]|uniref:Uncharacterized protein n=1 Tax=Stylosanthes scabra TaxID=79078 RepID=A0ABU6U9R5_9FABA|nr:hypothetical protein [Stylosanthes scabra]